MKRFKIFIFLFQLFCLLTFSFIKFEDYFVNRTLRVDYFHIVNSRQEIITIDRIYQQGIWASSLTNLIDNFNNGGYYIKVYDLASNKLIFSMGFNSYCGEYKTTDVAIKGIKRTYHETVLIPYPKNKIKFVIECRNRKNYLIPIFDRIIDPKSIEISKESLIDEVKVFELLKSGDPHEKVDLVFVGEGYTKTEETKLKQDLKRMLGVFFSQQPYKKYRDCFNVYGVYKPSKESGCDEPTHGVFKNTSVGASFNALGLYRYLLTEENRTLRDISAHVPYDAIIIMVNSKRYGGGGIYNFYCVFTVDNPRSPYLLLHEFGHSFTGLADEYYTSSVVYNEFYPKGVEPNEPNITALLDPKNLKWKSHVTEEIGIPTDWGKDTYEKMNKEYRKNRLEFQKKIAEKKKKGTPEKKIRKLEMKLENYSKEHREKEKEFFTKHPLKDKVGAFEGAGYSAKGLFRPMLDCLMFSSRAKDLCRVCEAAVVRVIKHYTK